MAQTRTYASLLSNIESLCGASFLATEQSRVKDFVNQRAETAWLSSDLWENMIVVGEERAVDNSGNTPIVPYTGNVYDTTEGVTDQNPYTATVDHFMRIHKKNPWNEISVTEYEIQGDSTGARLLGYDAAYGLSTSVDSAALSGGTFDIDTASGGLVDFYVGGTVKVSGFDTNNGVDPNGTYTITGVSGYTSGITIVSFALSGSGSWATLNGNETVETPSVFCTYKKRLSDTTYGDGSGETTAIPNEWFNYLVHGASCDILRNDKQYAAANSEERYAREKLSMQLERLDRMHTSQTIGKRILTHGTEQARTSSYR